MSGHSQFREAVGACGNADGNHVAARTNARIGSRRLARPPLRRFELTKAKRLQVLLEQDLPGRDRRTQQLLLIAPDAVSSRLIRFQQLQTIRFSAWIAYLRQDHKMADSGASMITRRKALPAC